MRTLLRLVAHGLTAGLVACVANARADTWPEVKTPPNARLETVASDMLLNGKPVRLMRFEVRSTDADVLAFYRTEFGKQVVENRVKNDQVIATRQGDYFMTVQLHALSDQTTRGTVMTTLLTAPPATSPALMDTRKLLPADTQVVSTMQTDDAGKRSLMVIGLNRNSLRANRDHLVAAMLDRGLRLTNEEPALSADNHTGGSSVLQLTSPTEEVSVTLADKGAYRSIIINRVKDAK